MRLLCLSVSAALLAAASLAAPVTDPDLNSDVDVDDCMSSEAKDCEKAGFDGCRVFADQQVNGTLLAPIPFCICLSNRHATATGCAPCTAAAGPSSTTNAAKSSSPKSDSKATVSAAGTGCAGDSVLALVSVHVAHGKSNGSRELSVFQPLLSLHPRLLLGSNSSLTSAAEALNATRTAAEMAHVNRSLLQGYTSMTVAFFVSLALLGLGLLAATISYKIFSFKMVKQEREILEKSHQQSISRLQEQHRKQLADLEMQVLKSGSVRGRGESLSQAELDAAALRALECPVCMDVAWPPTRIYQCMQGHVICGDCRPKLARCPMCRQSLDDARISRNLALEQAAIALLNKGKSVKDSDDDSDDDDSDAENEKIRREVEQRKDSSALRSSTRPESNSEIDQQPAQSGSASRSNPSSSSALPSASLVNSPVEESRSSSSAQPSATSGAPPPSRTASAANVPSAASASHVSNTPSAPSSRSILKRAKTSSALAEAAPSVQSGEGASVPTSSGSVPSVAAATSRDHCQRSSSRTATGASSSSPRASASKPKSSSSSKSRSQDKTHGSPKKASRSSSSVEPSVHNKTKKSSSRKSPSSTRATSSASVDPVTSPSSSTGYSAAEVEAARNLVLAEMGRLSRSSSRASSNGSSMAMACRPGGVVFSGPREILTD